MQLILYHPQLFVVQLHRVLVCSHLIFFFTLVHLTMILNVHLLTGLQNLLSFVKVNHAVIASIGLLFHSIARENILSSNFLLHRGLAHPLPLLTLKLFAKHHLLIVFLLIPDFFLFPKYDFRRFHKFINYLDLLQEHTTHIFVILLMQSFFIVTNMQEQNPQLIVLAFSISLTVL